MRFVDISHWNGVINFKELAKAVDGVILKVSQGTGFFDNMFNTYYEQATAAGIKVGAYVFMVGTTPAEAKAEAAYALRCLGNRPLPLGLWLDIEDEKILTDTFSGNCIEEMAAWMAAGYNVGIYCNLNWYRNYLSDALKLYPLWIARYGKNNGLPNPESKPSIDMFMWQYTSQGVLPGINGRCDLNEVYKTFDNLPGDEPAPEPEDSFTPHVKYKVYTKKNGWLPEVLDLCDYAGIKGRPITAFAIMATEGKVKYRCHVKNGRWYPYVTGYAAADFNNGYAGDLITEIDAIEIIYYPPEGKAKRAKYRVSPTGKEYYSYQWDNERTNGQDGYAGMIGKSIDRVQVVLED